MSAATYIIHECFTVTIVEDTKCRKKHFFYEGHNINLKHSSLGLCNVDYFQILFEHMFSHVSDLV